MIISIFNTTEQRKGGYTPSPWTSPAPPSQTTSALGKTGGRPRGTARLLEIDFLRLVSMLAVISIHVSSTYLSYETGHLFLGMNLAFLLNQAARFSVPLFLLLSGFSLEQTGRQVPYLTFLRTRSARVLPPYLGWVLLYALANTGFDLHTWGGQLGNPPWLLRELLTGQGGAPSLFHPHPLPMLSPLPPAAAVGEPGAGPKCRLGPDGHLPAARGISPS